MYPLKFENLYYDKVWGGRGFELFRNNLPKGSIGESWDVACHKNGTSIIANGKFKGISLDKLIETEGTALVGSKISADRFPLLVKLINANESLSVQVHPSDEYGKNVENDMGKTEVWYVLEAFDGANLIVGTKSGCTKEQLKKAIESGNLEYYMNKINVKKGDVYFIKSGLIHAIGQGVVIAEIQQNSDTTYRVYDYGRGRELHVEKALEVVDLTLSGKISAGIKVEMNNFDKTYLCLCKDFSLEMYEVKTEVEEFSDEERFFIFTCVDGNGEIIFDKGNEKIFKGDSILIPASLGKYVLKGSIKLLKSYVPDTEKVEKEILENIRR